jgi:hypothetical protein
MGREIAPQSGNDASEMTAADDAKDCELQASTKLLETTVEVDFDRI